MHIADRIVSTYLTAGVFTATVLLQHGVTSKPGGVAKGSLVSYHAATVFLLLYIGHSCS